MNVLKQQNALALHANNSSCNRASEREQQETLAHEDVSTACCLDPSEEFHCLENIPRDVITVPEKQDVLCGKDSASYTHPGNKRFRNLVAAGCWRYRSAVSREAKTFIANFHRR